MENKKKWNPLARLGWWRTDDGRWFRHGNDDGTDKRGLNAVEWAWKPGEYGPYLGFYFESGNTYNCKRRFFIGFLFGRVWVKWVARTKNKRGNRRYGFELGRKIFYAWWNCDDHERACGMDKSGFQYCSFWWDRFKDVLLGKTEYLCQKGRYAGDVQYGFVTMPEGDYPAVFTFKTAIWYRKRSPFRKVRRFTDIDVPIGIPCSGKGENSWDCGDDAVYGTGCEGHDVAKAALHFADVAAKLRVRRGDPAKWPMSPADRVIELEKLRAKHPENAEQAQQVASTE